MNDIVFPSSFSKYQFPKSSDSIKRSSVIETIEIFSKENDVVYLSAKEGWGKTTILSQLADKNVDKAITLHIDPSSRYSYSENSIVRDIYVQLKSYLGEYECIHDENITSSELGKTIGTIEYTLLKDKKTLLFIIDGLDEIPEEDAIYIKSIADILPVGAKNIKFIVASENGSIKKHIRTSKIKELTVSTLTRDEAAQFIPEIDDDDLQLLIDSFGGIPERLTIIKRLIEQGLSIEDIIENRTDGTQGLFEKEWDQQKEKINKVVDVIGIIAYSAATVSEERVLSLSETSRDDLDLIKTISFIESKDSDLKFKSLGFKSFAKKKLSQIKNKSLMSIITLMEKTPKDIESLKSLANYYKDIEDNKKVVSQLSNDNLELLIDETKSLNDLFKQINLGIECAKDQETDLLRLCYMKSLLSGVETSPLLKSEMKHLLLNDDVKSAIDLAYTAISNEDRLQMLCLIASDFKEKNQDVPEHITSHIENLYENLVPEYLGIEKTLDIAMDIFPYNADYALSLINKIDAFDSVGQNKSDYAFFKFTLEAVKRNPELFESSLASADSISAKKNNVLSTINNFKDGKPAEKIISSLENIGGAGDQLFILRNWIKSCKDRADIYILVRHMYDLALETTEFSANASFYADISECMKHIENKVELLDISDKLNSQLETVRKLGPTIDYIKILVDLNDAQARLEKRSGNIDRVIDYIREDISDSSISLASLCITERSKCLSESQHIQIQSIKDELISEIVEISASQLEILQEALTLQCETDFKKAVFWCSKINTERRRSEAYAKIINHYCDSKYPDKCDVSIDYLCQVARRIKTLRHFVDSVSNIISFFSRCKSPSNNDFKKLVRLALKAKGSSTLCNFSARLINLALYKEVGSEEVIGKLETTLSNAWDDLDGELIKIDHAFRICNILSKRKGCLAKEYKEKAITLRKEANTDNYTVADALNIAVTLSIRAAHFIISNSVDDELDIKAILSSIEMLPSDVMKAEKYAMLASSFQKNGRLHEANKIGEDKLIPLIENSFHRNSINDKYANIVYHASPILLLINKQIWERKLEPILHDNTGFYDEILCRCIRYIMHDCIVGDPYDPIKNHEYKISYSNILQILSIVELINDDESAYSYLNYVTRAAKTLKKSKKLSRAQENDIKNVIENIAYNHFPKVCGIKHDGYKLLAQALPLFLIGDKDVTHWNEIVNYARNIPNKSDSLFVISALAELMPISLRDQKESLFEEAYSGIESIPLYIDRLGRYQLFAESSRSTHKNFAKKCLKSGLVLTNTGEAGDLEERRLEIIDAAYSLGEDFPSTLSTLYNDDPARQEIINENVKNRTDEIRERDDFTLENSHIANNFYNDKYSDIAWKCLGELNANNHNARTNGASSFLISLSNYSHEGMYPLLSYYIHLVGSRCSSKDSTTKLIKPIFDVLISNSRSFSNINKAGLHSTLDSECSQTGEQILIDSMQSEKAIQFIKKWVDGLNSEEITIVDPYFSVEDLKTIGLVINKDPSYELTILTSLNQKKQMVSDFGHDIADAMVTFWKENVSTGDLPDIEVVFVGAVSKNNDMPIHDRWWLSGNTGLRVGTSINGIANRLSEITVIKSDEVASIDQKVSGYITRSQKMYDGEKVRYELLTLY